MDFENVELTENLRQDLLYLGVIAVIVGWFIGFHNYTTPDNPKKVGMVETHTDCYGVETGVCLGIQRMGITTYNYDNYQKPEPGTENFYRLVESELMLQAQNICDEDTDGMNWVSEAEYRNKTGGEWLENENVQLLSCDKVPHRGMGSSS